MTGTTIRNIFRRNLVNRLPIRRILSVEVKNRIVNRSLIDNPDIFHLIDNVGFRLIFSLDLFCDRPYFLIFFDKGGHDLNRFG